MSTEEQKHSSGSGQESSESELDRQEESGDIEQEQQNPDQQANTGEDSPTEALQAEIDNLREELLRAHADMQNLRRRVDRDVENAHKYALEKFVGELVAVVDNLERATSTINKDNEEMAAVGEGVELTLKSFLDVLGKFKVEQLDPAGEPFDPDRHQAMTMVPNPDVKPNTVLEVFQKGYLLNGRLIRPAMVVVSQGG